MVYSTKPWWIATLHILAEKALTRCLAQKLAFNQAYVLLELFVNSVFVLYIV